MPNWRPDFDNEFTHQVRGLYGTGQPYSSYGATPSQVRRPSDTPDTFDFLAVNRLEVRSGGIYNGDQRIVGGTLILVDGNITGIDSITFRVAEGGDAKRQMYDTYEFFREPQRGTIGSVSAPTYSFNSDPDTGFYSNGISQLKVAVGGTNVGDFTANGWTGDVDLTWSSYTPSWASTGTAPAIGNGSITGQYLRVGDLGFVSFSLTGGSTTTWGTGAYLFGMPSGWALDTTAGDQTANGFLRDASTSGDYPIQFWIQSNETMVPFVQTNTDSPVTNTNPFTFTTDDIIRMGTTAVRLQ